MRRILVERARREGRQKYGERARRIALDEDLWITTTTPDQVLAVDEVLAKLAAEDLIAAEVVKDTLAPGFGRTSHPVKSPTTRRPTRAVDGSGVTSSSRP